MVPVADLAAHPGNVRGDLNLTGREPNRVRLVGRRDHPFVMAVFIILNSFLMNVNERRRLLSIMRAVGATRRQIIQLLLGEGLMLMPAGNKYPGKTAGPGFGLTRHVMLPPHAKNARRLCSERFKELAALAAGLLQNPLPNPVRAGCLHLQEMADTFDARVKL